MGRADFETTILEVSKLNRGREVMGRIVVGSSVRIGGGLESKTDVEYLWI